MIFNKFVFYKSFCFILKRVDRMQTGLLFSKIPQAADRYFWFFLTNQVCLETKVVMSVLIQKVFITEPVLFNILRLQQNSAQL
ncbi:hypothetical protein ES708_10180 [subsurface metagenome]